MHKLGNEQLWNSILFKHCAGVRIIPLHYKFGNMKTKRTFAFGASLATGAAIWALSPALTGEVEPWDANTVFLPIAIVIVSLSLGFLFPKDSLADARRGWAGGCKA